MIVTCFYDIYNKPENFTKYFDLFYKIGNSGIPIILFTAPNLVEHFKVFSSVNVIGLDLKSFELYNLCMAYNGELPNIRCPKKDTKEFLSLMNSKIEFVLKASEISDNDTFVWVDFGILKIINNIENFINKLKLINEKKFEKITIPGCWKKGHAFSVNKVNWRFCGGILIIPKKYIQSFYDYSKITIDEFCSLPDLKLTWETNIWNIIEERYFKNDEIHWYSANHDDRILIDNI
jgi:hypothetical protein